MTIIVITFQEGLLLGNVHSLFTHSISDSQINHVKEEKYISKPWNFILKCSPYSVPINNYAVF